MAIKVTSEGGLLYFLQKLRQLFVPRELRTGSSSEYKVLSDNNLTDGLVAKIENADSHVFSGSYSDLTAKPSINGRTLEGSQSLADLGIAAAADVPTRVSQLANDSGFAVATTVGEDIAAGDKATLASAKKYADDKAAAIHVPAKVSELTNDSGYQTSADVQSSVDGAVGARERAAVGHRERRELHLHAGRIHRLREPPRAVEGKSRQGLQRHRRVHHDGVIRRGSRSNVP
ncbi:MAG: hypothetical protein ACLU7P_10215 [Eggerthella lenta]